MLSYKSDSGRIPRPRKSAYQVCNASPPAIASSSSPICTQFPRSQIARPVNTLSRTTRSSSLSSAEESRPILPVSGPPRSWSSDDRRPSLLPRPATQSLPQRRPSPSPLITSRVMQPSPSPLTPISPSPLKPKSETPASDRPRNVLRRKAPTIGQRERSGSELQTETSRPETLKLIIPTTANPGHIADSTQKPCWDQSEPIKQSPSSRVPKERTAGKVVDYTASHGPKELASLRTATINTQNLPLPTPAFASASSLLTRYSESPGIWSRTSTPTTLTSFSPGFVGPAKIGSRLRQPSPSHAQLPIPFPSTHPSPQADRGEPKTLKPAATKKVTESRPFVDNDECGRSPNDMRPLKAPDPPRSPPPRKSSMNLSPPKQTELDAETISKQEKNAARQIFDPVGKETATAKGMAKESTRGPQRPSRENTHQLDLQSSPVIQSNLPFLKTTGHKRRESAEKVPTVTRAHPTPIQAATVSVDSLHPKTSSQKPSRIATPSVTSRRPTPTLTKEPKEKQGVKNTAAKRLGLFSRKSKSELHVATSDQNSTTRKGPAAGTGHEGYGKYAYSGRRPSVSSSSARSVSSSKGSVKSRPELDLDDFLLHRLEPVVINGGGMDGASLMRTQSEQSASSLSVASTSNNHSKFPHLGGYSTDSLATSIGSGAEPARFVFSRGSHHFPVERSSANAKGSTTPAADQIGVKPALRNVKETSTNQQTVIPRPSIDSYSYNSSVTSLPQMIRRGHASPSREKDQKSPSKKEHASEKKGRKSFRWNFFQRSHGTERKSSIPPPSSQPATQLHATVSPVSINRPVAHYALVDVDSDSLPDILRRIEDSPPTEEDESRRPTQAPAGLNLKKVHGESMLLPSPPKLGHEFPKDGHSSPKVFFKKESTPPVVEKRPEGTPKRQSRLAPVGRIPQVVSRSERERKPAMQSFSRPFSFAEAPSLTVTARDRLYDYNIPDRSTPNVRKDTPAREQDRFDNQQTQPFSAPPVQRDVLDFLSGPYAENEFLAFSPRKDSVMSSSSGSEGTDANLTAVTAIIPEPGSAPTDDEVWGEYDDLIEHLSPSASESRDRSKPDMEERFTKATTASKTLEAKLHANPDEPVVSNAFLLPLSVERAPASTRSCGSSVRLRHSRIASALRPSPDLSTQASYSDLIADYGDQNGDDTDVTQFDSTSPSVENDQQQTPPALDEPQKSATSRQRNSILLEIAERHHERTAAQTNIRSGSLMTSRWLSFGRVLFSPAHKHVTCKDRERILVIDGLGNDDWSFYCALTYPNADVFSLNVCSSSTTGFTHPASAAAAWQPLTNHHTIRHPDLESPFPFPKGYFAVTVLRFPASCSGTAQSNVISECKRVLRSGGYLEMSLLDLDMVNMGIRTRKAVRGLKERIYMTDANISLKPVSDSIQRLLGTHGFDNLRRCMVRIPVAGIIVRSSDSSSSSSNRSATTAAVAATTNGTSNPPNSNKNNRTPSDDSELSLGDLLSDPSPSPSNDESITKIVAKVGRWWYTRCYELSFLPNGDLDHSIWADSKLLRECQKQGTGFRLLIAYAQKPSEVPRRTASV